MEIPGLQGGSATVNARWTVVLRGAARGARAEPLDRRHLIMVRQPGWQSAEDWQKIADHVGDIDPGIAVFVVRGDAAHSYVRRQAAKRPTLIFSPGQLRGFSPRRGRVYQGGPIPKLEQLRRLGGAGIPVPRSAMLTPDLRLDPAVWGDFVILKPSDLTTSSQGAGVNLLRTSRVRFKRQSEYPEGHPGRLGPMIVQQFINTGDRIAAYRVLTLFGEPLYAYLGRAADRRIDLDSPNEAIESAVVATQNIDKEKLLVSDADVIALARAAHAAIPEVPLKGCDILRDVDTGALCVLEVNAGGNTWHFSSDHLAAARRANGPEFERRRLEQFDALRTAGRLLAAKTLAEAE